MNENIENKLNKWEQIKIKWKIKIIRTMRMNKKMRLNENIENENMKKWK